MKMKTAITALGLLSLATFGASAAELVNQQQAPLGVPSVTLTFRRVALRLSHY